MKYTKIAKRLLLILCFPVFIGCGRQEDWLDIKNSKGDVLPETLADFQHLLNNGTELTSRYSTAGLTMSDNLYLNEAEYLSMSQLERNLYTWNREIWDSGVSSDWNFLYAKIEIANLALEGLKKIDESESGYANIKGQALFFRSLSYYFLVNLFCTAYDDNAAQQALGLPLRTDPDVNVIYRRSSLRETFDFMIRDAELAAELLDTSSPYNTRPSKQAAFALLAKIYLLMGDYRQSLHYGELALDGNTALLDFNDETKVNMEDTYRFPALGIGNSEIIYYAESALYLSVMPAPPYNGSVTEQLYRSYHDNDLRKSVFYLDVNDSKKFIGTYTGSQTNFCGIALNEIYFILAESYNRLGDDSKARHFLNEILMKRYKTGTYRVDDEPQKDALLTLILNERRKELPFTANIRWEDLRRLNKEADRQSGIERVINGVTYSLLPNENRYVLPIPEQEIQISNITQNQR